MRVSKKRLFSAAAGMALAISTLALFPVASQSAEAASAENAGKDVAFTRAKGNCLACHLIQGGESPGTIGPPLIAMQSRFKSKQELHDQIWDATKRNPETPMPPFGKYGILTPEEVNQVVEFVWNL